MTEPVQITFAATDIDKIAGHEGRVVLVVVPGGNPPVGLPDTAHEAVARALSSKAGQALKPGGTIELAYPSGLAADALQLVALPEDADILAARKAGAAIGALLGKVHTLVLADGHPRAADVAMGIALRAYDFSIYKTRQDEAGQDAAGVTDLLPQTTARSEGQSEARLADGLSAPASEGTGDAPVSETAKVTFMVKDPEAVKEQTRDGLAVASGVLFTRDLVNEPANVLTTTEFAARLSAMTDIGLSVEVLGEDELQKLGMGALLAVGQGSESPSKVVVMRWNGGVEGEAPLALVGKGVVFDTGGISIKPGAGMEEMTMDMGGAGVVSLSLIHI